VNVASFVLRGCPVVAKTAIRTSGAARMAGIAIRWDLMALSREQELFPHFGEAHNDLGWAARPRQRRHRRQTADAGRRS